MSSNARLISRRPSIPKREGQKPDVYLDKLTDAITSELSTIRIAVTAGPSHTRVVVLPSGDTTPDVGVPEPTIPWTFTLTYAAPTTITTFDGGREGQIIVLIFLNANVTLQHAPNIFNRSGVNDNPAANTTKTYVNRTNLWYEVS